MESIMSMEQVVFAGKVTPGTPPPTREPHEERYWQPVKMPPDTYVETLDSLRMTLEGWSWNTLKFFYGRLPSGKRINVKRSGFKKAGYHYRIKVKNPKKRR